MMVYHCCRHRDDIALRALHALRALQGLEVRQLVAQGNLGISILIRVRVTDCGSAPTYSY
jgi:hypothetical protein